MIQMGVWRANMTVQTDDTITALWLSKCFHPPTANSITFSAIWELNFLVQAHIYAILVAFYTGNLDPLTINVALSLTQPGDDGCMHNICKKQHIFYCNSAPAGKEALFGFSAFW